MQDTGSKTNDAAVWEANPARKKLAFLFELCYWLLILEGALRKWFLPFLTKPLFFVRDPIMLYMYFLGWTAGMFPTKNIFLRALALLSLLFVALIFGQVTIGKISFPTGFYGWRMYFLSVPIAFLAANILTGKDLKRLVRRSLIFAIPMAIIVFFQYRSPSDSFINKSVEGNNAFTYGELARASGTFSFTQGHLLFCHSVLCMLLTVWLLPQQHRPIKARLLVIATIAVLVNILLDGNRAIMYHAIITMAFSLVYRLVVARTQKSWRTFAPEAICVVAAVVYLTLLTPAFEAMKQRMENSKEDADSRIVAMLTSPFQYLKNSRVAGVGVGTGTAAGRMLSPRLREEVTEETEIGRVIAESGPLGMFFVAIRILLALSITREAFIASKRTQNPLPWMIASFAVPSLIIGQLTMNGTYNGYGWMFAGIAMAANRLGLPPPAKT